MKLLVPDAAKKFGKKYGTPLAFIAGAALVALVFWVGPQIHLSSVPFAGAQTYPEAQQLNQKQMSFQEYSTYFQQLSDTKGAVYAFEVLKRASFPPGVDIHLLGHVVGDMLYKQKGIDGIQYCTQDFRNACSHSIVIGVLNDKGPSAMPDIAAACKKAPGGPGAYTMCFHGLGHGVLAYTGYDLQKAVVMCKLAGTPEYHDQEYIQCVGGTIMEMIAGVHDPIQWQKQVGKFFKTTDALYPCDASWMPAEVKGVCYVQLTPHLFTAAGGNLGNLQPTVYPKAFSFCDALPKSTSNGPDNLRQACYSGFGKEFTVIAQGRDIRDIGSMGASQLTNVRDWCAMAHDADGEMACQGSALASLFWGGENNPDASFTFCGLLSGNGQKACYGQLAGNIGFYDHGTAKAAPLCARLPQEFQGMCTAGPQASQGQ